MLAVFLLRVKPASQRAKPGCIQKTNMAANSIHTVSSDNPISFILKVFMLFYKSLFLVSQYGVTVLARAYRISIYYITDENSAITNLARMGHP